MSLQSGISLNSEFFYVSFFVTSAIFSKPAAGLVFDCDYGNIKWWYSDERYSCEPRVITSGNLDTLEGVSSNHLPGKSNKEVIGLYIRDQSIKVVPKDIAKLYPNINSLSLVNIDLKTIARSDFEPFPQLESLQIQYNFIDSLPNDLLQSTPKLKIVVFKGNHLRYIGVNIFNNLPRLTVANFQKNPCIDLEVVDNPNKMIDLVHKIRVFCPPTFDMVETYLLLSQNFLDNIEAQVEARVSNTNVQTPAKNDKEDWKIALENLQKQIDDLKIKIEEKA